MLSVSRSGSRIDQIGNRAGDPPVAGGLRGRLGKAVAKKPLLSEVACSSIRGGLFERFLPLSYATACNHQLLGPAGCNYRSAGPVRESLT